MDHRYCLIQAYQLTGEENEVQGGSKFIHLAAQVTEAVYSPGLLQLPCKLHHQEVIRKTF